MHQNLINNNYDNNNENDNNDLKQLKKFNVITSWVNEIQSVTMRKH